MDIRFGLLGPLQVQVDDRDILVSAARQRVLLVALLLRRGRAVPAAQLADLVWDDQPPQGSAVTLRSYVMRLRQVLGHAAGHRITTATNGYQIEASEEELDVARYNALFRLGDAAADAGAWEQASELFTQAEGLWRGRPLEDISCQALQVTEVPRLEQLRLQVIQRRIEADLYLGRPLRVIPELVSLTSEHPLHEAFHAQLMLALHHSGRQADALAAYGKARDILVSEAGIEPGSDLRQLHRRLLAGAPLPGQRRAGFAGAPAPSPPRYRPEQLPPPPPGFVGRAAELQKLTRLLGGMTRAPNATMIVVVSGTAGVGKTALVVHWAHQVARNFPDGQLYLNLNGFGPAGPPLTQADAITTLLEALQTPSALIPASLEGRVSLYRTLLSGRRMLLMLDNARDAEQVRPLLPGGTGCLVLVTSRTRLAGLVALEGALPITLNVFTPSEARTMVAQRLEACGVDVDGTAIDQLASACARLPLALAIAAARLATQPSQSVAGFAEQLIHAHDRLRALSTGEATTNLTMVFDWSYGALSEQARRMFRLLAVHPGPDVGLSAAASLAGIPSSEARDALDELAGSHLVTEHVEGRFAVHDLLRLYAAERLCGQEDPAHRHSASQRMLDHYLHTALTAARTLSPTRESLIPVPPVPAAKSEEMAGIEDAMAWLEAEHQVMKRLIPYAAEAGFDTYAWQLPWALTDFFDRAGHWHDWVATQQIALGAAQRLQDLKAQAHAHRYLGRASFQLQEWEEAERHLSRALQIRHQLREPAGEAGLCLDLCRIHEKRGNLPESLRFAEQALALYQSTQHRLGQAFALHAVGWAHALMGNAKEALSYCTSALALSEELDCRIAMAHTWHTLGLAHGQLNHPDEAITCCERAVRIYGDLGDRYLQSHALACQGDLHREFGDSQAARRAWERAFALLTELNHPDGNELRARIEDPASRPDIAAWSIAARRGQTAVTLNGAATA
jgi:DNA-binding SARP family transcriptional activator/tetratricopeptide (TPR) repeat protein